jgi:hypothetical protein
MLEAAEGLTREHPETLEPLPGQAYRWDVSADGRIEVVDRVKEMVRLGRLTFTTDLPAAVRQSDVVFIAVGTPQGDDGAADLSNLWAVGDAEEPPACDAWVL